MQAAVLATRAAPASSAATVLYVSVGKDLHWFRVEVETGALQQLGVLRLPSHVQYAAFDLRRGRAYVASSDGVSSSLHFISVLNVAADGALSCLGEPVPLPRRPIFVTLNDAAGHLLVAYNNPSGLQAFPVLQNGGLAAPVQQSQPPYAGRYAHCVRFDGRHAILCARGDPPIDGRPDFPGAVVVFEFDEGRLRQKAIIAPNGGIGFRIRHVDLHPSLPFAYFSLEANNELAVLRRTREGLAAEFCWRTSCLAEPAAAKATGARASALRVDPLGRAVYVLNRADATRRVGEHEVFTSGENNVAVFRIDGGSGEPVAVQHADTHGFHPRELTIDPSGKVMAVINVKPRKRIGDDGSAIESVPGSIALFRVCSDARLDFIATYGMHYPAGYDHTVHGKDELFWLGMPGISIP